MKKPENPSAFPIALHYVEARGMSLRDYFAGQVIAVAMMDHLPEIAVRLAYECADALLAERAKEPRS